MTKDGKEAPSRWLPALSWRGELGDAGAGAVHFWRYVLLFTLIAVVYQVGDHILSYKDYIGRDPDDSMRLVEVRDFLRGQGWFDLTQYRLGLDGGTLMHWSRLIDLPIAALILFFSVFLSPHGAEVAAALVWPLLLVLPLMASTALAGYRIGGRQAMLMALGLGLLFIAAIVRFRPGALDHHNVQLVLVVFITAMLLDPLGRASNFVAAAIAGAAALAIGAETTPFVACAAACVAVLWGLFGARYQRAAAGFGLAFALATSVFFVGTTPARLWSSVTCDTLSIGYFSLSVAGGLGLAAATLLTRKGMVMRLSSLVALGAGVLVLALLVAPKCLGNPLDDLDPLLQTMWLGGIGEAQSIVSQAEAQPDSFGGFYAVGLFGIAVCVFKIRQRQQIIAYAIMIPLIAVSWIVTAVQVRGMIFANYLAFIPLSVLIADLRANYLSRQSDARAAAAFVGAVLASIPSVWTFSGAVVLEVSHAVAGTKDAENSDETDGKSCPTQESLAEFARQPVGRVLSTANPGSWLLRFTPHSVLTANYHRNQTGMIAALKMQMASPAAALDMIRRDKVAYVMFCVDDPQVETMKEKYPDGFFARLADGEIPEFLEPLDDEKSDPRIKIFRVL